MTICLIARRDWQLLFERGYLAKSSLDSVDGVLGALGGLEVVFGELAEELAHELAEGLAVGGLLFRVDDADPLGA